MKITSAILLITLSLESCSTNRKTANDNCFSNAIELMLSNDVNMILHQKDELLIVANINHNVPQKLRLALMTKQDFPEFLFDKKDVAMGYTYFKNIFLLGYGDCSKYINLSSLDPNIDFLKPYKIREPKLGNPPYPPPSIEPLVYSFTAEGNCFYLSGKTVADTLIE